MQKKHLFIPFIALTLLLSTLPRTFAASPSPSPKSLPSPSPISSEEVTENLKKRLQESLGPDSSELSTAKARGYIGIVKDVIKDTIILEDKDGKKDVKIQDDTTLIRSPAGTTIKPENIRIDDYIIAIGYPGTDGILQGKRIIVSADPIKPPAKTSGLGTIVKISKTSLTLKVDGQDQIMDLAAKTIIKSAQGTLEQSDLSVGDTMIYTATIDKNDDSTATILMRTQTSTVAE